MKRILFVLSFFTTCVAFAQGLIINEVLPSNANHDTLADGSSPDWIELYNSGTSAINLKNYTLSDDAVVGDSAFVFPDTTIAPKSYMLVYAMGSVPKAAPQTYWETMVKIGDLCRYNVPTEAVDAAWVKPDFDDSKWLVGKTGIGYGDNDDLTLVPSGTISVLMRQKFTIPDVSLVKDMFIHLDFDDGFVVYINGNSVASGGLYAFPAFDATSSSDHEAQMYSGGSPLEMPMQHALRYLHSGENVIAIEVHNSSASSSDLSMIPFLTLGFSQPQAWFKGVSPFVSITNTIAPAKNLYALFKLNADKDTVFLSNNTGLLIDKISFSNMPINVSQGRLNANKNVDYWFANPTPGKANTSSSEARSLSKPIFSLAAGIYSHKFKVGLSNKDGDVAMYYTTDGSLPSATNGTLYTDSITITKSTPLRACATRINCIPSEVTTGTYIISNRKIEIPVVAISVKPSDFFDTETGIYVLGNNASTEEPYYGANYWQDWEKQIHFELFEPSGERVVSVEAGAKISGNWTRVFPQKSLKLYMRKQYGDSKIKYRIFKDKSIDEFEKILIRNSGNDFNITQMRDGMISVLARNMNVDRQAYRPTAVFINGEYWGVQEIRERLSPEYINENFGVDKDSVSFLESNASVKQGSNVEYNAMMQFIMENSLSDSANYAQITKQIDIQNYIDYVNTEMYVVNNDWPGNNIRYWRMPNGKWRWMLYDTDFGYGIWDTIYKVKESMLDSATTTTGRPWPNPEWSTRLLRNLITNTDFKHRLMNSMADRLNTTFSYDSARMVIDSLQKSIRSEMPFHKARWGGEFRTWVDDIALLDSFARKRPFYVWRDFKEFFSVSGLFDLQLSLSNNAAGRIELNSITISRFPWTGKYFNDIPITVKALPKPGYRFVRWEGASSATTQQISITSDKVCNLKAVFEYDATLVPQIVINEIMYNDAPNKKSEDWLELYNKGTQTVDLSGWILKNEKPYTSFVFAQGMQIKAGEYLIVCKDSAAFKRVYQQNTARKIGNTGFDFAEDHDVITLFDASKNRIDEVSYTDTRPWPSKADGLGYSIERQNTGLGAAQWKALTIGGTAGLINANASVSGSKTIVISEINYNDSPNALSGDWFEVYNTGATMVDLSQWLVEDMAGNRYVLPQGTTLEAGEYLVLANNMISFSQVYPSVKNVIACPISLSSDVERLLLFDKAETLVDSVQFSSHAPWPAEANGRGYTLNIKDVNANNELASNWAIGRPFGSPGEIETFTYVQSTDSLMPAEVVIFPNPATDFIRIQTTIGSQIVVTDASGRVVYRVDSMTDENVPVSVSQFSKGIYCVSVFNQTQMYSLRFVKL